MSQLTLSKKNFEIAERKKAILISQIKDNQSLLREQVDHCTKARFKPYSILEDDIVKQHGRIEERKYEFFEAAEMLKLFPEWRVETIIKVTRKTVRISAIKEYKDVEEISYYASSKKLTPKKMANAIRRHWHIENVLHYVKDTAFIEDKCKRRRNPAIFATVIDFAMNIMRANGCSNIRGELYSISLDFCSAMKRLLLT